MTATNSCSNFGGFRCRLDICFGPKFQIFDAGVQPNNFLFTSD